MVWPLNSILTLALEKLLLWQDSYDLIGSRLGRVMNWAVQGDVRLWGNRSVNTCKMPWFLFGVPLCCVPNVPELTCPREHGETLLVIKLNGDHRLPAVEAPDSICRRLKSCPRVNSESSSTLLHNINLEITTVRSENMHFWQSIEWFSFSLFYLIIRDNRLSNCLVKKKVL